jgi:hypothetical protein
LETTIPPTVESKGCKGQPILIKVWQDKDKHLLISCYIHTHYKTKNGLTSVFHNSHSPHFPTTASCLHMNNNRQEYSILSVLTGISSTVQQYTDKRRYIQDIQPLQVLQRLAVLPMIKKKDTLNSNITLSDLNSVCPLIGKVNN